MLRQEKIIYRKGSYEDILFQVSFVFICFVFICSTVVLGRIRFLGQRAVSNEIGRQLQIKEKLEESLGCANDFNCAVDLYDK